MDFKLAKGCTGCDNVLKNIKKITGKSSSDTIEDGLETTMGPTEVPDYLETAIKEGKVASKKLVDNVNANSKPTTKRLAKKIEGDAIAFRVKKGPRR